MVDFSAAPGEGGEKKQPTIEIQAYTGSTMKPSYMYWPTPVVVDLKGLTAAEPIAILLDHYSSQIVGQSTKVTITSGRDGKVVVAGVVTGDTENPDDPAAKVVMHAKNGFKWKASVGIEDQKYEFVQAGQTVDVNGREFAGPVYVLRAGTLNEVSLLSIGADKNASAKIAAQGENEMDFHAWLQAQGWDPTKISDKQRDVLLKAFKAEQGSDAGAGEDDDDTPTPAPKKPKKPVKAAGQAGGVQADDTPDFTANGGDPFADIEAENVRKARLNAKARKFAEEYPQLVTDVRKHLSAAVSQGTTEEMFELQLFRLKGERAPDNRIPVSNGGLNGDPETRHKIFEAGLCLSGKLANIDKHYQPQIVEAAERQWRHGLGLGEFLLHAGREHGFSGLSHRDVRPLLEAAFSPNGFRAAGPSTYDVSGILSNVANKFIVDHFNAVGNEWRQISAVRPVNDFKQITSYSLTGDFTYQKVAPGGEITHGTMGEVSYTNQADTYGRMFAIDRRDIINDDLGAFTAVNRRLGRGGALKLNEIFWAMFMNNTAFFTSARGNFDDGTDSALSLAALTAAEALFMLQTDPDGKPMSIMPEILLVPPQLKRLALQYMNSTEIRQQDTTTDTKYGTTNTFNGNFRVVSTPYLANTTITGNSALKWYLLANPANLATIETCFLNGVETPTVESAQADFNILGIQLRGFFDFGVALQEYRAGVAFKGEN